ncbi:MAG: hypothetical protein ACOCUE_04880, partial [Candidatus Izemoplasmataceae bacterium]
VETLFSVPKAFEVLNQAIDYDHLIALSVLMIEGEDIETRFKLSKKLISSCKQLARIHLISKEEGFTNRLLFNEGIEAIKKANQLNKLYGIEHDEDALVKAYNDLPIKEVCELAFKGEHIIKTFDLKNRSHIGFIIDELILSILNHQVKNTYEALKKEAEIIKNRLEKSDYYE